MAAPPSVQPSARGQTARILSTGGPRIGMLCDGNTHELAEALRVEWMKMTEPTTHGLLWELDEFPSMELQLTVETEARLPKRILDCKTVQREVRLQSAKAIPDLSVVQRLWLHNNCIEGEERNK